MRAARIGPDNRLTRNASAAVEQVQTEVPEPVPHGSRAADVFSRITHLMSSICDWRGRTLNALLPSIRYHR